MAEKAFTVSAIENLETRGKILNELVEYAFTEILFAVMTLEVVSGDSD